MNLLARLLDEISIEFRPVEFLLASTRDSFRVSGILARTDGVIGGSLIMPLTTPKVTLAVPQIRVSR